MQFMHRKSSLDDATSASKPTYALMFVNVFQNYALWSLLAGLWIGWHLGLASDSIIYMSSSEAIELDATVPHKAKNNINDGWKSIDVFYGKGPTAKNDQRFFSQARQDEAVLSLLGNTTNGFFVDLAANHATDLSNTYALEKHYGWKGLCIEPNPKYWYSLSHLRENCRVVAAVVGKTRMDEIHFRYDGMELGGIVGKDYDNRPKHLPKSRKVYTVTLLEIFQKYEVPSIIDYMSLDVEGAEEFIMGVFPIQDYKIKILSIERPKKGLQDLLALNRYKQIQRLATWGETLWIHESLQDQLDTTHIEDFSSKENKKRQQKYNRERGERIEKAGPEGYYFEIV